MTKRPRYPIYIPSKGRYENCHTAKFLLRDQVPFFLVVEKPEADLYRQRYGSEHILVLPFQDRGSVIPARNWIKDHATDAGYDRHWQLDDNIRRIERYYQGKRIPCHAGIALAASEDFVDRYENIAIAGLNYTMFIFPKEHLDPPFYLNNHVYSCTLILNQLPHRWRGRYNEDTDYCLQVLADNWCTVLINVFLARKIRTMTVSGGNTQELYQTDGRLKMARALERLWPGVVTTNRRFRRPQHIVADNWRRFDTPLKLKSSVQLDQLKPNEYGLKLRAVNEVQSSELQQLVQPDES